MSRNLRRNPHLAIASALDLHRRGQLDQAEATLRDVISRNPRAADALHLLGLLRHERGDLGEALALVGSAVEAGPANADAWRNLGNLCVEAADLERGGACFREVLRRRPADVAARGSLALLLERSGRPDEAIQELRELLRATPNELGALGLLAKLLRRQRRHEDEVRVGRRIVALLPGDATQRMALSRSYFLWFDSVDQDAEAARRVLAEWVDFDPADPVAVHMLAARRGTGAPARASDGYVQRHFDEFAATFDEVLAGLGYCGPELVEDALRLADPAPRRAHDVADLGCGTGACGPRVRPWARSLVGVDLAEKMLEKARARRVYDELQRVEMSAFLAARPSRFNLVLCADALIYVGDLAPFVEALAGSLRPGGRFIATAEIQEEASPTFHLHGAGRYAHAARYVKSSLESAGFTVERFVLADLRREFTGFVKAAVVTARLSDVQR